MKGGQPAIRETVVVPFGRAKKQGDSTTLNAISKICNTKKSEHQLSGDIPSVIWMDYQDEIWDIVFHPESVYPIRSFNGEMVSGELWYAFYGWKGAPVFENHTLEKRINTSVLCMQHDGRFRMGTALSSVIVSFRKCTAILENPFTANTIPEEVWTPFSMLPWFSVMHSYTQMFSKDLAAKVDLEKQSLDELASKLKYSW